MYELLVIDDEQYAVDGILRAIDWSSVGIANVHGVNSVQEAKEAMYRRPADVIICDIEMPGESGVDFLEWLKAEKFRSKLIFLTGYSRFEYAQKSVGLGASEFLIKPVDHTVLKNTVEQVLCRYRDEQTLNRRAEAFEKYRELWESQKPALVNRLWLDLLEKPLMSASPDTIREKMELYEVDLYDDRLSMALMRSEWNDPSDSKQASVMMYGLCNIAQELLLPDNGIVIKIDDDYCVVLFYNPCDCSMERIEEFIETVTSHLDCEIECYLSENIPFLRLNSAYTELKNLEARRLFSDKPIVTQTPGRRSDATVTFPPLEILSAYVEAGRKDSLEAVIDGFLREISGSHAPLRDSLRVLYYRIISVAATALHQRGEGPDPRRDSLLLDESVCNTVRSFRSWVSTLIDVVVPTYPQLETSSLIHAVKDYIQQNLSRDLTRESIANEVYLNPSYLSRLFHKETGERLTDYIMRFRIHRAKQLLEQPDGKVTSIAHAVGYNNDSYFIKVFKSATGLTPHEYRKSRRPE